ncbi:MAG: hypothetical protein WCO45_10080 [Pseudanabaena sp. ELA607]|jgi:hypothetical protein
MESKNMKLKKPTQNLSLGQSKKKISLGFNLLTSRVVSIINISEENSVMLKRFLDFLWNDAKKNSLNLVSYTSEMDARVSALTEGVEID